jgi:hypothetical protein
MVPSVGRCGYHVETDHAKWLNPATSHRARPQGRKAAGPLQDTPSDGLPLRVPQACGLAALPQTSRSEAISKAAKWSKAAKEQGRKDDKASRHSFIARRVPIHHHTDRSQT